MAPRFPEFEQANLMATNPAPELWEPEQAARLRGLDRHLATLAARLDKDTATKREIARMRLEIARLTRHGRPHPPFWLICGPGPFGPVDALERHLRSLRGIEDKGGSVFQAIRDARRSIRLARMTNRDPHWTLSPAGWSKRRSASAKNTALRPDDFVRTFQRCWGALRVPSSRSMGEGFPVSQHQLQTSAATIVARQHTRRCLCGRWQTQLALNSTSEPDLTAMRQLESFLT